MTVLELTAADGSLLRGRWPSGAGTVELAVLDATGGEQLGTVGLGPRDEHGAARLVQRVAGSSAAEHASRALLTWAFEHRRLTRADWRATVGDHAARLVALRLGFRMVGLRPVGDGEEWLAALVPGELTEAGHALSVAVARQAEVFGAAPPVLTAGELRLRAPAERDRPAIVAAYQDPDIIRWYGVPAPYTDEHAGRLVHGDGPREWARGTEAIFAVTGPGDAWAGTIDLRVLPGDPRQGEVGFLIAPHARGRGWATAALTALVGWAFAELGLARVQWRAEVGNTASRRVAERAGFTVEGLLRQSLEEDGRRYDCWVGSILSTERVAA